MWQRSFPWGYVTFSTNQRHYNFDRKIARMGDKAITAVVSKLKRNLKMFTLQIITGQQPSIMASATPVGGQKLLY